MNLFRFRIDVDVVETGSGWESGHRCHGAHHRDQETSANASPENILNSRDQVISKIHCTPRHKKRVLIEPNYNTMCTFFLCMTMRYILPDVPDGNGEPLWRSFEPRVGREGEVRLGHADGHVVETLFLVAVNLDLGLGRDADVL
jgi:hypothetical protein